MELEDSKIIEGNKYNNLNQVLYQKYNSNCGYNTEEFYKNINSKIKTKIGNVNKDKKFHYILVNTVNENRDAFGNLDCDNNMRTIIPDLPSRADQIKQRDFEFFNALEGDRDKYKEDMNKYVKNTTTSSYHRLFPSWYRIPRKGAAQCGASIKIDLIPEEIKKIATIIPIKEEYMQTFQKSELYKILYKNFVCSLLNEVLYKEDEYFVLYLPNIGGDSSLHAKYAREAIKEYPNLVKNIFIEPLKNIFIVIDSEDPDVANEHSGDSNKFDENLSKHSKDESKEYRFSNKTNEKRDKDSKFFADESGDNESKNEQLIENNKNIKSNQDEHGSENNEHEQDVSENGSHSESSWSSLNFSGSDGHSSDEDKPKYYDNSRQMLYQLYQGNHDYHTNKFYNDITDKIKERIGGIKRGKEFRYILVHVDHNENGDLNDNIRSGGIKFSDAVWRSFKPEKNIKYIIDVRKNPEKYKYIYEEKYPFELRLMLCHKQNEHDLLLFHTISTENIICKMFCVMPVRSEYINAIQKSKSYKKVYKNIISMLVDYLVCRNEGHYYVLCLPDLGGDPELHTQYALEVIKKYHLEENMFIVINYQDPNNQSKLEGKSNGGSDMSKDPLGPGNHSALKQDESSIKSNGEIRVSEKSNKINKARTETKDSEVNLDKPKVNEQIEVKPGASEVDKHKNLSKEKSNNNNSDFSWTNIAFFIFATLVVFFIIWLVLFQKPSGKNNKK